MVCTYAAGYYRFGSNSDTPVRCVYVSCHDNDMCIFTSPEDGSKLQVSMQINPLNSSDNCMVNYVEIIHDCKPRRVDLILNFISYPGDNKLYLQVSVYNIRPQWPLYIFVTGFGKTDHNVTIDISRNTD